MRISATKLNRAEKVVKVLRKSLASVKGFAGVSDLCLEAYSNCREQGFTLQVSSKYGLGTSISFAEARSSDQMFVECVIGEYVGTDGNIGSAEAYRGRAYFSDENGKKAEEWAAMHILSLIKQVSDHEVKKWNERQSKSDGVLAEVGARG